MRVATAVPVPTGAAARAPAMWGLTCAGIAVASIGALHVLAAGTVDPIRSTISEYALGSFGLLFHVGVLALAGGAALVLAALLRTGQVRAASAASVLYGIGMAGLVPVVVFEKTNWAIGPSVSGSIHRYASLVAFVALPLGVALVARRVGARWAKLLGAGSLAWLVAIFAGIAFARLAERPWWQVLPLGLMERGLALTLVAAVVALGVWVVRQ
ncbi:MAG: DUF998 domain-containing protein [Pseudonocardia sp.]|nr:DUF998 domain-containing protein [Pseudonocardia sp.]